MKLATRAAAAAPKTFALAIFNPMAPPGTTVVAEGTV